MVLSLDESAALRDNLLNQIVELQSENSATRWAQKALTAKNKLTFGDANLVEDAFEKKFAALILAEKAQPSGSELSEAPIPIAEQETPAPNPVGRIDKSVLTISTPRRHRNKEHIRFVTKQPCLVCDRKPSDPHHLRFVQPRAFGRRPSDEFVVPLCRTHHRALHRTGNEEAWWKQVGIDPIKVARELWKRTRMTEKRIERASTVQSDTCDSSASASDNPAVRSQVQG
jgi:hypothetical protein